MPIDFSCPSCGKKFRVKEELAGKLAKCTDCGNKVRIPVPVATTVPAQGASTLDDLLDDVERSPDESSDTSSSVVAPESGIDPAILALLKAEEKRNNNRKKGSSKPTCPSCGRPFVVSTIVCVNCGYDAKAGSSISSDSKGMTPKSILTSFDGRIPRSVFLSYSLLLGFVGGLIWSVLPVLAMGNFYVILIACAVLGPAFVYFGIALAAKRWHDRDKSGWWILIQFVPVVGAIWQFIELGCLPGTAGSNGYGPDPLAPKKK